MRESMNEYMYVDRQPIGELVPFFFETTTSLVHRPPMLFANDDVANAAKGRRPGCYLRFSLLPLTSTLPFVLHFVALATSLMPASFVDLQCALFLCISHAFAKQAITVATGNAVYLHLGIGFTQMLKVGVIVVGVNVFIRHQWRRRQCRRRQCRRPCRHRRRDRYDRLSRRSRS